MQDGDVENFPPRGSGVAGAHETAPDAVWQHPARLDARWNWTPDKLLCGAWQDRLFGWRDDRNIVTVAGSRAGKSSTMLIPNLRRYPGSVLVIDPKSELARATASYRLQMGQDVYVLDPFGVTDLPSASHNPFDEIGALYAEDSAADTALMADALIISHEKDPHWTDSAKNLVRGLSLYLLATSHDQANLKGLRACLHADPQSLENLLTAMRAASPDLYDGIVRNVGTSFLSKLLNAPTELQSILSTAQEQTAPLDDIIRVSGHSDFKLAQLKQRPMTVYLVLPGMRIGTHFRWLRLVIQQAIAAMERAKATDGALPVLFILEEFAALGHMRPIETAAGFMAGFGMKLWAVLQDLTQLKTHYPNSWETFLGNAGVVQAFGNVDLTTTEYLSKRLGSTIVIERQDVGTSGAGMARGDLGEREHLRHIPLLDPSEITRYFARETNRQIILVPGERPIYMNRLPHE